MHFVLVHGSGQNASSWARVGSLLEERGHTVAAPDLPKQEPEWTLEDHARVLAECVDGPDTVVAAHSLSGILLPIVHAMRPCRRLVFVAAVIPEPGRTVRQQFEADASMFSPAWIEAGPRWFEKSEEEALGREFLFHDCDESTIEWALTTIEGIDTRGLVTQPCPLDTWPDVPCASIVATHDRTVTPDWIRRASERILGISSVDIDAGHCPHMSRPDEVAALLAELESDGG